MVKININIQKKDLWLLSAIIVFLVGVGFVVAYNNDMSLGQPDVMGHSSGEILVDVPDYGQMSLQSAITAKLLGNGSGGGMSFGVWNNTVSAGNPYYANTEGIVVAYGPNYVPITIIGYTNGNVNPTGTIVARAHDNGGDNAEASITFPVKLGDYWQVNGASTVRWLPIVSGGSSEATYVSPWQSITPSTGTVPQRRTFTNPFGTDEIILEIQFKDPGGTIHQQHNSNYGGWGLGIEAYEITSSTIKVVSGSYLRTYTSTGQTTDHASGEIRILLIKI